MLLQGSSSSSLKIIKVLCLSVATGILLILGFSTTYTDNHIVVESSADLSTKEDTLQIDKLGVCKKGHPGFSKVWMKKQFAEFVKVYDKRLSKLNEHGTRMTHQFAMWATIRYVILYSIFIQATMLFLNILRRGSRLASERLRSEEVCMLH